MLMNLESVQYCESVCVSIIQTLSEYKQTVTEGVHS